MFRHLSLALLFAFAISFPAKAKDGFTTYLTTDQTNRYGGNIMLDAGTFKPGELGELFDEFDVGKENSILPKSDEAVEVIVVVPKGASVATREEFAGRIRDEVQARYPNMRLSIRESYVDLDADRSILLEQKVQLLEADEATPDSDPMDAKIKEAIASAEEGLRENENLRRSWGLGSLLNNTHPYNTIIAARVIAVTKFIASGSVIVSKYGVNAASLGIGTLAGGVAAFFGYNAKRWSNWCTSHVFPFWHELPQAEGLRGVLARATYGTLRAPINFYNRTGWLKSANINLWRSLGISYVLRELAYLSGQTIYNPDTGQREVVDSPNDPWFFIYGLGLSGPEIVLDGLMDDGARAMELKGRWNHQTRSYALWAISLVDTVMHALFRAGAVELSYKVAVVSWGLKLAQYAAGYLLPAGPKRFIFVSDEIGDEALGKIVENRKNFFTWLAGLPSVIAQTFRNRAEGRFSESDQQMIEWNYALEEAWNMDLTEEQLERIHNDPSLTQQEFNKWLNLKDTDSEIKNALWKERTASMGARKSMNRICASALAKHSTKDGNGNGNGSGDLYDLIDRQMP